MSALQNNVDALRAQLAKQEAILEQQKREAKEKKERSWGFNMGVLKRIYEDKKMGADTRISELERRNKGGYDRTILKYKKSYEQDAALFRLFKHLGDELWEIECKIQQNFTNLDERLMHIEKFLDIKKEEFLENTLQNNTATASSDCIRWGDDGKAIPPPWYNK